MTFPERPRLQQEASNSTSPAQRGRQRCEKVYHVFTHQTDMWTGKRRKAEKTYRRFAQAKGAARLYQEIYQDRENDVMLSENCLKGFGDYPL
jgi:hypothetical protein